MLTRWLAASAIASASVAACSPSAAPPPDDSPAAATVAATGDATATSGSANAPTAHVPAKTDLFTKTLGDPKNPAVIYVHGGPGGNGTMFEDTIAPQLVAKGLFAVSYDQRGAGRSPPATAADFTIAKFVDDLDDVIFTLGLSKPVLLGHSWGGTLSLRYQDAHPDKVAGTVLVSNPVDFPDSLANIHTRCLAFYNERFLTGDDIQAIQALHQRMFPNGLVGPFDFSPADVGQTMQAASDCKLYWPAVSNLAGAATTWGALMLTSPDKDLLMAVDTDVANGLEANDHVFDVSAQPLLAKLKDRVYGIYGDTDGLFSTQQLDMISSTIGASHFSLIAGASHIVFVDAPDDFTTAFLSDVAALEK